MIQSLKCHAFKDETVFTVHQHLVQNSLTAKILAPSCILFAYAPTAFFNLKICFFTFSAEKYDSMHGGNVEFNLLKLTLPQKPSFGFFVLMFVSDS